MEREEQTIMALRKEDFNEEDEQQETGIMKRTCITIDISPELRRRIKMAALQNDQSISEYLGDILEKNVPAEASIILEEEHPVTPDYLEQILRVRERIMRESKGQLFEDSAEMVRQMREERTKYLEELREQ